MEIEVKNLAGLDEAAQKVLEFAQNERFFIFEGDMGAGKTTFIKALTKVLGVTDVVSSPTFSIVNEYEGKDGIIYHFDFYRLKNLQEAYDIGYEEYFYSEHICLIEWPEKVEELLPEHYVKIEITATGETERLLSISKI
ncbi:tRNA (adenosine(37)-N6)-threonylcarbamoyltransferase complex ATPase subunit type 1 TsaE [Pedobacter gandavensis]|uniref:tRNA (adenosine(37)-N6)-threonylcarbamoyltransferase complex ATPase subunit type 1 TsaE n=1 Tax=Pedobacter TaxID=84567 RepID=UPI001C997690|nr:MULTISPECIES: tRNA (adenosine(37)-N6)-threonylcarbamoyltransferase complex ATPase subunit type 1 TsaE [Pedobacter]WGQ07807.1 tRNA (adenosine(37)-N6)-threonylcarbamoyltransferase complex ATPase subunit type 1 TsaE [Pedobacter gandavensis]